MITKYDDFKPEILESGEPLLVSDMPNEVYHSLPGISKSGLDLIARSPAHYAFREFKKPTAAMNLGSAAHAAILEPELFERDYLVLKNITDKRSSEYKQAVKQFAPEFILTANDAASVLNMRDAVAQNTQATERLRAHNGIAELSVFAHDPHTGVLCKARFDHVTLDGRATDLKTTVDLRDFARSVANYRYHVQQAFYSDVWHWATGCDLEDFLFLAVEKDLPCANRLIALDKPSVDYGRKLYREALNTYAKCLKTDTWPMPDMSLEYITLPSWAADPEEYEGEF